MWAWAKVGWRSTRRPKRGRFELEGMSHGRRPVLPGEASSQGLGRERFGQGGIVAVSRGELGRCMRVDHRGRQVGTDHHQAPGEALLDAGPQLVIVAGFGECLAHVLGTLVEMSSPK